MADKNVFDELLRENEAKFEGINKAVKNNIEHRKDIWTLLGELIELFIPRLVSTMLGLQDKDKANKKRTHK